jgi:hypothetical protein
MFQKSILYISAIITISFIISYYFFWDKGNEFLEGSNIIFRAFIAVLIIEPIQKLISRKPKKEDKGERLTDFIENFFIYWLILLIPTVIIYCI